MRKAKGVYKTKIESKFAGGSLRDAWKGIKNMASMNTAVELKRSWVIIGGMSEHELPNYFY